MTTGYKGEYIGKITYIQTGIFRRDYWLVVYDINKNLGITSSIFYNFERARIFSKIVQIASKLKVKLKE